MGPISQTRTPESALAWAPACAAEQALSLLDSCAALLAIPHRTAREILGTPDDMKLRSCATLFAQVTPPDSVFMRILGRYFGGESDQRTLDLIQQARSPDGPEDLPVRTP